MSIFTRTITTFISCTVMIMVSSSSEAEVLEPPIVVKAAQHLRVGAIVQASDLIVEGNITLSPKDPLIEFIGKEVKRNIYAGKIVAHGDLRAPTAVARNAIVQLEFSRGALLMTTEGRALSAGAVGESIRVMNLTSKVILSTVIIGDNKVTTR